MEQIQTQEQWVLHRLEKFYSVPENLERVRTILSGDSDISLRLIDWFVTNYAKNFNVAFLTHLKAYSKKMFDPFCRWKRIKFHGLDTTVGQLNFFEWAISDGILAYLDTHKDSVHVDMESRLQELKDTTETPELRRRRHELSHSATKSLARHDVKVKITFD